MVHRDPHVLNGSISLNSENDGVTMSIVNDLVVDAAVGSDGDAYQCLLANCYAPPDRGRHEKPPVRWVPRAMGALVIYRLFGVYLFVRPVI